MKMRNILFALIAFCCVSLHAQSSWTVTQTGDAGTGSLREAIYGAVAHAGADTIRFAIPEADSGFDGKVWMIKMTSLFINLSGDSLVIDGRTQTAFGGDTHTEGPEVFISGELLGEDTHGFSITGNDHELYDLGLTGFQWYALAMWQETAQRNRISGCHLGAWIQGVDTLRNRTGIFLSQGTGQNVIEHNVISGNSSDGIYGSQTHGNVIQQNSIGLAADGITVMGNGGEGIDLREGSFQNIIGGHTAEAKNCIVGNGYSGIAISGSGSRGNAVLSNNIGVHADGETPQPNGYYGIHLYGGASANVIGEEGAGNIISGNRRMGINLSNAGTDSNAVAFNRIGLAALSDAAVPNGEGGIRIMSGASDNSIGPGNFIQYNSGPGIRVTGAATLRNTLTQNRISNNDSEGIDLVDGGNAELASPVIEGRSPIAGQAAPGATVELFSDSGDEGRVFEGTVTAEEDGHFSYTGVPGGPYVTATATDEHGNTSAFSAAVPVGSIWVTSTADLGEGTLRWALSQANNHAGPDTIDFRIPQSDAGFDGTVWRIQPSSNFPALSDDYTMIRGASQAEFQGETNPAGPEIVLDGSQSTEDNGLTVMSSHNVISGLVVSGCHKYGITLFGHMAKHNVISGCYVGTTPDGLGSAGSYIGILIDDGADSNRVGGMTVDERNVLSGNINDGVHLGESHHNVIIGNFIGTDPSGLLPNGNGVGGLGDGVDIRHGAQYNTVGGFTAAERNIISGNASVGVRFHLEHTSYNRAIGNWIGLNVNGDAAIPNGLYGVFIHEGASLNSVGGLEPGAANVISGNTNYGVGIIHSGSIENQILGNWIGLNSSGSAAVPNGICGVSISYSASDNIIGPANVISGNAQHGIFIDDEATDRTRICGNWIGLDPTGQDTLANGGWGIAITGGADAHVIGDTVMGGNVLSGNRLGGIAVLDSGVDSVRIAQNQIGLDGSGQTAPGNGGPGIELVGHAHQVIGNTIVASAGHGLVLAGAGGVRVSGNDIGIGPEDSLFPNDSSGIVVYAGAVNDTLGPDNRIRGNGGYGIALTDAAVSGIVMTQNSISGHAHAGIDLAEGANSGIAAPVIQSISPFAGQAAPGDILEIFSDDEDEGLIYEATVYADAQGHFSYNEPLTGLYVTATARNAAGNSSAFSPPMIIGELIVTHSGDAGMGSLRWAMEQANLRSGPNTIMFAIPESDPGFSAGIWKIQPLSVLPSLAEGGTHLRGESQTESMGNTNTAGPEIVIDGALSAGEPGIEVFSAENCITGLVISNFAAPGIVCSGAAARQNSIGGCYIGTTADGRAAAGNRMGILLEDGAGQNTIGGFTLWDMNVISGNVSAGLVISGADSNVVIGNRFGTDGTGFLAVANGRDGVGHGLLISEAIGNRIGGSTDEEGNLFSGNEGAGIGLRGGRSMGNAVLNNGIGVDASGLHALPNTGEGVAVSLGAVDNIIGPGNRICYNEGWGLRLGDPTVQQLKITANSICQNDSGGVFLAESSNGGLEPPMISGVSPVTGTAQPGAVVEVFSDSTGQGGIFEGRTTADQHGTWQWEGMPGGPFITALAIDDMGNASAFADPVPLTSAVLPERAMPRSFALRQNYPNPFNPVTHIDYALPVKSKVSIIIYNVLGRPVDVLVNAACEPGHHRIQFNAQNLPSGIYFCRLQAGDFTAMRKMILLE